MSNFLAGFGAEILKLASAEDAPAPLILTRRPSKGALEEALHHVEHQSHHDQGWKKVKPSPGPVRRNYLASMLIGAVAAPAMGILGKGLGRTLRNHELMRAARVATDEGRRAELLAKVEHGPLVGRFNPDAPPNERPVSDLAEVSGRAAQGALTGSALQMLRDHFSGGHH